MLTNNLRGVFTFKFKIRSWNYISGVTLCFAFRRYFGSSFETVHDFALQGSSPCHWVFVMDFWQMASLSLSIVSVSLLLVVSALMAEMKKRSVTKIEAAFTLPPKRLRNLGPYSIHKLSNFGAVIGQRFRPDGWSLCPMKHTKVD